MIKKEIINYLKRQNYFIFVALLWLFFTAFHLIFVFLHNTILNGKDLIFNSSPNLLINENDIFQVVFQVVFIGPLIETFFSQKLLFSFLNLNKWLRINKYAIILIGSLSFGLIHFFSLSYIIFNSFVGGYLMFVYIIRIKNKPYITVFTLHALNNFTTVILYKYFEI